MTGLLGSKEDGISGEQLKLLLEDSLKHGNPDVCVDWKGSSPLMDSSFLSRTARKGIATGGIRLDVSPTQGHDVNFRNGIRAHQLQMHLQNLDPCVTVLYKTEKQMSEKEEADCKRLIIDQRLILQVV